MPQRSTPGYDFIYPAVPVKFLHNDLHIQLRTDLILIQYRSGGSSIFTRARVRACVRACLCVCVCVCVCVFTTNLPNFLYLFFTSVIKHPWILNF